MVLRWFPWRFIVSRVARARGLVDPVMILSRLESFAQPLELKEPLELLRAGLVFHARGLLNTTAIQHNLDWIWPYWVRRQYDPSDVSFIPRAFSATHINLTHRSWTAIGRPGLDELPIVDPRGLVTPFWDGWSIDAWIIGEEESLVPSATNDAEQKLEMDGALAVTTRTARHGLRLVSTATVVDMRDAATCVIGVEAAADRPARLAVSVRPSNPEGVSFVHEIEYDPTLAVLHVGRKQQVKLSPAPDRVVLSDYGEGDVRWKIGSESERSDGRVRCEVGMATAAAVYEMSEGMRRVEVRIPLEAARRTGRISWSEALSGAVPARLPDEHLQFLYDAAIRSLILHSPGEVYPGPYTYRRFWFRDAAFILDALLRAGLSDRVEPVLDGYPDRQKSDGFFLSQEGEWDSNGEAIWIIDRFCAMTGRPPKPAWIRAVRKGAEWIVRKRTSSASPEPHAGLLPAGFSAEHLGPNDYYYWDDFWGVAGLRSAARLLEASGESRRAAWCREEAQILLSAIDRSLAIAAGRLGTAAMPASPYRRLDSGAIGSLAAGYPTEVFSPNDARLVSTVDWIVANCMFAGGFYQDIVHSGINPYLTLHLAQVLLRAGDPRARALISSVARIASPTGQWPEALHPKTGGGCMGDGHHAWASAEWLLIMRNCFLREEGDRLIVGSGIFPEWLESEGFSFGPAPTEFGEATVSFVRRREEPEVSFRGTWRAASPTVELRVPGFQPIETADAVFSTSLSRAGAS